MLQDVVNTLERVCSANGYPKVIRVDQGTEFVSQDMDLWAYQKGLILDFSRLGKRTDNAIIEAFNSQLRAECPNTHWFMSMPDAQEKLESWPKDYDKRRPHDAIGNKTPISLPFLIFSPPQNWKIRLITLVNLGGKLGSTAITVGLYMKVEEF